MRILYIDIDSLRADHLGCYGYHRATSPNIDAIAQDAVRFDNVYNSDAPCLPSRTALFSGRNGFHTGVVDHAGTAGQPFVEGPGRRVHDLFWTTGWMQALRERGLRTVTISSFADRHAAWHWYAGFDEFYNPGGGGNERADQVTPIALDWLQRRGKDDNWFLHVNLWDPHTPYRTPMTYGNPFASEPVAAWLTEAVRQRGWDGFGPHSPQEPTGYDAPADTGHPRIPAQLDSMDTLKQWIDGYDVGIHYTDAHIGRIVDTLSELNILDEVVIMIGADHAENQGELNVYGDHQTADQHTCRVPLIVRWPGLTQGARVDSALHYHFDWAATMIELLGGEVPANWDGQSFAEQFRQGQSSGRDYLVTSQAAWSCQRGIRFDHDGQAYMALKTYHDGFKMLEPYMLFNLTADPHEQHDLAAENPSLMQRALAYLDAWYTAMMDSSATGVDPMMVVMREGGPSYTRGILPWYSKRLRATGRAHHADRLEARHPNELSPAIERLHPFKLD